MNDIIEEFDPLNHEKFHSSAVIIPEQYGGAMLIHVIYHSSQKKKHKQHLSQLMEKMNCNPQRVGAPKSNQVLDFTEDGWIHQATAYNDFERTESDDPTKVVTAIEGSYSKAAAYVQPKAYQKLP